MTKHFLSNRGGPTIQNLNKKKPIKMYEKELVSSGRKNFEAPKELSFRIRWN